MSDKQICNRCVIPSSYPRITFDNNGVCSICNDYEKWTLGWHSQLPDKKKILEKMVAKAKSRHKEFDALIPYSGGKDSSFVLYVAKKELDLNCLAYTLDTGYLSNHAKNNIDKACRKLGVEHIYYRFNPVLMNKLFALFVRKTGYPCTACMRAIGMGAWKFADLYNIPLVIGGTSLRTELPLSREMAEHGHKLSHIKNVFKDESIANESKRLISDYSVRRKFGYLLFNLSGRQRLFNYAWINLADYYGWNYSNMRDLIQRELDWTAPEEDEHMDCIIHPIQNYIQLRRFPDLDLDKLKYARLIMAGQMTREDALQRLDKPAKKCPKSVLNLFLENIKMTKEEFDNYIDMGPRHLQYNSPTIMEELVDIIFHRRKAGNY